MVRGPQESESRDAIAVAEAPARGPSYSFLPRKGGVVANPFDDPDASYCVLVNDEGQHSLWPVFADIPEGWHKVFGEAGRQECLDHIEKSWTDLRPKSLIAAMENGTK